MFAVISAGRKHVHWNTLAE